MMKKFMIVFMFLMFSLTAFSETPKTFFNIGVGINLAGSADYETSEGESGEYSSSDVTAPGYVTFGLFFSADDNTYAGFSFDYMSFTEKEEVSVSSGFLFMETFFFSGDEGLSGAFFSVGFGLGGVSFSDSSEGYLAGAVKLGAGISMGGSSAVMLGLNVTIAGSLLGEDTDDTSEVDDNFVNGGFVAVNIYFSLAFGG